MKVEYLGCDAQGRVYQVKCGPDDLPPIPLGQQMAAAPEMYEALKWLVEYEQPPQAESETLKRWNAALTAIAHAEGRQ